MVTEYFPILHVAATVAHAVEQQPNMHVAVATGPARTSLGVLATLNNTKTNTMIMEDLFIVRCWPKVLAVQKIRKIGYLTRTLVLMK